MIQVYNKEKSAEEFDAKNEENNLSNMAGRYASNYYNLSVKEVREMIIVIACAACISCFPFFELFFIVG